MICSSGIGFDPVVNERRLTFGFEGVFQGTAVLYDHQTRSLWMHLTGECFEGELEGTVLERIPSGRHTTWADWSRTHTGTDVMKPDPRWMNKGGDRGYFAREGAASGLPFFPEGFQPTIQTRDDRLAPTALVYGIDVDGVTRAYAFDDLAERLVVEETVNGVAITVWFDRASRSAAAFRRTVGELSFSFTTQANGARTDHETKSAWNMEGECVDGASTDLRLEPLHGLMAEWYGWVANHPKTSVWGRDE